MSFGVLADDRFLVVAGHIVPFDTISVEVIQDSQASLIFTSLLGLFTVIGLTARRIEAEIQQNRFLQIAAKKESISQMLGENSLIEILTCHSLGIPVQCSCMSLLYCAKIFRTAGKNIL